MVNAHAIFGFVGSSCYLASGKPSAAYCPLFIGIIEVETHASYTETNNSSSNKTSPPDFTTRSVFQSLSGTLFLDKSHTKYDSMVLTPGQSWHGSDIVDVFDFYVEGVNIFAGNYGGHGSAVIEDAKTGEAYGTSSTLGVAVS